MSFGKKRFMKIIKVCVFLTSIFSTDEWSDFWSSFTESLEPDDEKKKRNELDDSWSAGKWKVSIFVHHLSFLCLLVYHLISSIILWWEFRNHVQHNWFLFFFLQITKLYIEIITLFLVLIFLKIDLYVTIHQLYMKHTESKLLKFVIWTYIIFSFFFIYCSGINILKFKKKGTWYFESIILIHSDVDQMFINHWPQQNMLLLR